MKATVLLGPRTQGPGSRPDPVPDPAPSEPEIPVVTVRPPQRPPRPDTPNDGPEQVPSDPPTGAACPQFQAAVTGRADRRGFGRSYAHFDHFSHGRCHLLLQWQQCLEEA